ncbi:MAG: hypothetical protein K8S16_02680 [Bacteroidales bacterium]|nr:hypothetical protein [Bacteroidales bacterium]
MEAIKQIVKTPRNHEIKIKIPNYVQENTPVEIILILAEDSDNFNENIIKLKSALNDDLFVNDLKEIS